MRGEKEKLIVTWETDHLHSSLIHPSIVMIPEKEGFLTIPLVSSSSLYRFREEKGSLVKRQMDVG